MAVSAVVSLATGHYNIRGVGRQMPGSEIVVRLFGLPAILDHDRAVHVERRKAVAVLAYVALADGPVSRDELCRILWPEAAVSSARRSLRTTLAHLRSILPADTLTATANSVDLRRGFRDRVDASRFARLADELERSLRSGAHHDTEQLQEALNLATGRFMDGFSLPECDEFDDWQFFTAERLHTQETGLLWSLIRHRVDSGHERDAIDAARRLLKLEPDSQEVHQELMILLSECGDRAGAFLHAQSHKRSADRGGEDDDAESTAELARLIASQPRPETRPEPVPAESQRVERVEVELRAVSLLALELESPAEDGNDDSAAGHLSDAITAGSVLHEGTVLLADSVCGVIGFGTDMVHEDDARRAVRCARSIREYLIAGAVTTRAVVVSGVSDPGSPAEIMETTLSALPRVGPGTIAVCEQTLRAVSGRRARKLGRFGANGLTLYELCGHGHRGRAEHEECHFVGRRRELHDLTQVCREATETPGWVALVSGEAGIGKSRLVREARRAVDDDPTLQNAPRWYTCQAAEHLRQTPLSPFREAVREMVRNTARTGRDDSDEIPTDPAIRACVEQLVFHGDLLPADILPATDILGRVIHGDTRSPLSGRSSTRTMESRENDEQRILSSLLTHCARSSPAVIVFEDLHWADQASARLLARIATLTSQAPLSLVVTYRTTDLDSLASAPAALAASAPGRHLHVQLDELTPEQTRDMVEELVSADRTDEIRATVERASGNPLYVTELCWLIRNGRHSGPPAPLTLVRILQRRTAQLDRDTRHVLNVAAVIGATVHPGILADVARERHGIDDIAVALERLSRLGIMFVVGTGEEADVRFSHALVRDAFYGRIPEEKRVETHRRVAAAGERRRSANAIELEFLIHHATRGGADARSWRLLAEAGDIARLEYDYRKAADLYERAIRITDTQPWERRIDDLRLAHAQVLHERLTFPETSVAYDGLFGRAEWAPYVQSKECDRDAILRVGGFWPRIKTNPATGFTPLDVFLSRLLTRTLIRQRCDGVIVPDAALSWTISPDGRHYRFLLRSDLRWSDGVPVTAKDYRAAIVQSLARDIALWGLVSLSVRVSGAETYAHSGNEHDLGVRAIDERTLEIDLDRPHEYTLPSLLERDFAAVPTHLIERYGQCWWDLGHHVSAGRYTLEALQSDGSAILRWNPHFHPGWPESSNIAEVHVIPTSDADSMETFLSGETDISIVPRQATKRALLELPHLARDGLDKGLAMLAAHDSDAARLTRPIRRALAMSIDRADLSRDLYAGAYRPANGGLIPPHIIGHQPNIGLPYDPLRASSLVTDEIRELFERSPLRVTTYGHMRGAAEFLVAAWKEHLGIRTEINYVSFEALEDDLYNPSGDLILSPIEAFHSRLGAVRTAIGDGRAEKSTLSPQVSHDEIAWAESAASFDEQVLRFQQLDRKVIEDARRIPLFCGSLLVLIQPWVEAPGFEMPIRDALGDVVVHPQESCKSAAAR